MAKYPFDLLKYTPGSKAPKADYDWVKNRPLLKYSDSLEKGAEFYVPDDPLLVAVNTALAVGEPLLVTGEPGTGKTQIAYFVARQLGLGEVLHFQTKSSSKAQDLLYHFDTIRYFHEAHLSENKDEFRKPQAKRPFITEGKFWEALVAKEHPRVLLIDEIDKAPRDFPNDLLRELDQNEFSVPELSEPDKEFRVSGKENEPNRPLIIITSNSERRLPEPFLRRCVYYFIEFNEDLLKKAVDARHKEYPEVSDSFRDLAIARFIELRKLNLRKKPSTGELLTWIRVLAAASKVDPKVLEGDLAELPFLGTLLKDHSDLEEVGKR